MCTTKETPRSIDPVDPVDASVAADPRLGSPRLRTALAVGGCVAACAAAPVVAGALGWLAL